MTDLPAPRPARPNAGGHVRQFDAPDPRQLGSLRGFDQDLDEIGKAADDDAADARRWKVWRRLRPLCLGSHPYVDPETGQETGQYQEEWATPEWMDREADRLAAEQEGT